MFWDLAQICQEGSAAECPKYLAQQSTWLIRFATAAANQSSHTLHTAVKDDVIWVITCTTSPGSECHLALAQAPLVFTSWTMGLVLYQNINRPHVQTLTPTNVYGRPQARDAW